ncbi:M48 family metallopeptidase [Streptomyces sp. NPDC050504]|uniref:M48 family metallopeptidase n=1 Tax=Streptomyces sp. NPDC050504 TaxID=3365618 RepID=UPI0037953A2D
MTPQRRWTEKLAGALRTTVARLLLLCLHSIIAGLVVVYVLGWHRMVQPHVATMVSGFNEGGSLSNAIEGVRRMVRWSVVIAFLLSPIVAPFTSAVLLRRAQKSTCPPGSVELEATDAPDIWNMVRELDTHFGTRMNGTSIWLTPDANATVVVSLQRGHPHSKTLYLGVPLLAGVDREELRAILCHELAHCAGRHYNFGVLALRSSRKLRNLDAALGIAVAVRSAEWGYNWLVRVNARFLRLLFRGYRVLYDLVTRPVRHQQEREADRVAARYVGRGVMRRALLRAGETKVEWQTYSRASAPRVSQDCLVELYRSLDDRLPARTGHRTRQPKVEKTSSHPALFQRVAALGAGQEDNPVSTGAPSLQLLASAADETGPRWPTLPQPALCEKISGRSARRPQRGRNPTAPKISRWGPAAMISFTLFVLSKIILLVENWPW